MGQWTILASTHGPAPEASHPDLWVFTQSHARNDEGFWNPLL